MSSVLFSVWYEINYKDFMMQKPSTDYKADWSGHPNHTCAFFMVKDSSTWPRQHL